MAENEFAMVSEWMSNGNINQFVEAHRGTNRFELVCLPFQVLAAPFVFDRCVASTVGGRCKGFGLYAWSGNGPWRPQGCASRKLES